MTLDEHLTGNFGEDQGDDDCCGNCKFRDNRADKDGWLYCVAQYAYVELENVCEAHERAKPHEPHTISEEGPTDENDPAHRFHDWPNCPLCGEPMTETRKDWPCYECQEEANENNREGER